MELLDQDGRDDVPDQAEVEGSWRITDPQQVNWHPMHDVMLQKVVCETTA